MNTEDKLLEVQDDLDAYKACMQDILGYIYEELSYGKLEKSRIMHFTDVLNEIAKLQRQHGIRNDD